jgi:hypothetical protein
MAFRNPELVVSALLHVGASLLSGPVSRHGKEKIACALVYLSLDMYQTNLVDTNVTNSDSILEFILIFLISYL